MEMRQCDQLNRNYLKKYQTIKVGFVQMRQKHGKLIKERKECLGRNIKLERISNQTKIDGQMFSAAYRMMKEKYPKLHEMNKDCMQNLNKIREIRTKKHKPISAGVELISNDKSQTVDVAHEKSSWKTREECAKWLKMKTDHDECLKSLENMLTKNELTKQIEKWKISKRQFENVIKKTQEQLFGAGESERFRSMITEKLDFVDEKYKKRTVS